MTSHLQTCSSNSYLACFVSNPSNNDDLKTIRFLSDNGLLHFDLILSSQEQANEDGDYDFLNPTRIYFEDFIHLFISYLAHDTSADSSWTSTFTLEDQLEAENNNVLRSYLLRQAVGINKYTSGIDGLNPSVLFSLGAQIVINSFKHGVGLKGFFDYLLDRQMLSLSSYTVTTTLPAPPLSPSTSDTLLSSFTSLWNQIQQVVSPATSSDTQIDPNQKLHYISRDKQTLLPPLLQEEYVTLGSDKALSYLNKFLRSNPAIPHIF